MHSLNAAPHHSILSLSPIDRLEHVDLRSFEELIFWVSEHSVYGYNRFFAFSESEEAKEVAHSSPA